MARTRCPFCGLFTSIETDGFVANLGNEVETDWRVFCNARHFDIYARRYRHDLIAS